MELPQLFIDEIRSYNSEELAGLIESLSTSPMVSVRANKLKGVATPDGANMVKWCTEGWYLPHRVPFTFDPSMHQGLYYVQDASSMIISQLDTKKVSLILSFKRCRLPAVPNGLSS